MRSFLKERMVWLCLALVVALVAVPLVLFADTVAGDFVTGSVTPAGIDLANVAPGAEIKFQVNFKLECGGNNHVDNGQSVPVNFDLASSTVPGGTLSATNTSIGSIPSTWPDDSSNCDISPAAGTQLPTPIEDNANSEVTINAPTGGGTYTYKLRYNFPLTGGNNDVNSITTNFVQIQFTFTVVAPTCTTPSVTTNPLPQTVTYGANATFTAAASGDPAPTVQWQVSTDGGANFSNIGGATNTTLTVNTPTVSQSGSQYRTVFTNSCSPNTATSSAATLTVNKANATINVTPYNVTYDGASHTATGTATGVLGEDLSSGLNLAGTTHTNAGSYTNDAWSFSGGTNYNDANGIVHDNINKATLTVTADNKSIYFGMPDPAFTFQYGPFVNSENASVIDTAPTCTVSGAHTAVGTYSIACSDGVDNNYAFSYVNGTLTVRAFSFLGFYAPVDKGIHNSVKGGAGVPMKFEIFVDNVEVTSLTNVKVGVTDVACTVTATDDVEVLTTENTNLRYDTTSGQFIFNWKTPKMPGKCYLVKATYDNGPTISALFVLR